MSKKWITYALVVLIPVVAYFANVEWQTRRGLQALEATRLDFQPLDQALLRARAKKKPVLADFSAIWCPTCRAMHATVFTDPAVKAAIESGYVLSRIDYESPQAPAFMTKYAVTGFPTLLVLDADGKLLRRVPVTLDPAQFAISLQRGTEHPTSQTTP